MKTNNTPFINLSQVLKGILGMLLLLIITLQPAKAQCTDLTCDRGVLMDIYYATQGQNWSVTWDTTATDINTWHGILVQNGRVIHFKVGGVGLTGSLPASFTDLSELKDINISNNPDLVGTLDISDLSNLTTVTAFNCGFTGFSKTQGTSDYPNLAKLSMNGQDTLKQFSDTLDISNLPSLEFVEVNYTNFTTLVTDTTQFPALHRLRMDYGNFSGLLDISGMHQSLQQVHARGNSLTQFKVGTGTFSELEYLWLHTNSFTGETLDISNMPALIELQAYFTQFSSFVTNSSTEYYPALTRVRLQGDGTARPFTGSLDISGMKNLLILQAHDTGFSSIITGTDSLTQIEYIYLHDSPFTGVLDISRMTTLKGVHFFNTNITEFNRGTSTFPNLEDLYCSNSKLRGTLDVTNMPVLDLLWAENNYLTGLTMDRSIQSMRLEMNRLTIEDLEPNASYLPALTSHYIPQAAVGVYGVYNLDCANSQITLEVEVDLNASSGVRYQWYKKPLSGGSFAAISGETGTSLTLNSGVLNAGIYQYWITHDNLPAAVIIKSENKVVYSSVQP